MQSMGSSIISLMTMKETLLTTLRDRSTTRQAFRHVTDQISLVLAGEAGQYLEKTDKTITTPLEETKGKQLAGDLVIIPILRAGLAMLPSFLRFFPEASVGFLGMRRDEETKEPHLYYENLPTLKNGSAVMVIDPMIATGGSGILAIEKIKSKGISENQIFYVGILAAQEGIERVKKAFPEIRIVIGHIDPILNQDAFIVPGLGDFGDRYFGTD